MEHGINRVPYPIPSWIRINKTCTICGETRTKQGYKEDKIRCSYCRNHAIRALADGTKAHKQDRKKIDLSLVPKSVLEYIAKAFMFGKTKYGKDNWKKGMEWTRIYAALLRHLTSWNDKEDLDAESKLSHLSHAAACLSMLIEFESKNIGEDNR